VVSPSDDAWIKIQYYCYQIARSAQLSGPIWVLFLRERGISFTEIGTLDSVFAIVVILAEAPTGYLADRIGRKNSLLVSSALGAVASVGFAFSSSFGPFLVLYSLFALDQTFRSGTESAWLYSILRDRFDSDQFAAVRGRGKALGTATGGAAAVAGGALGEISLALPWIVSGGSIGVAFLVLLTFPEAEGGDEESFGLRTAVQTIRSQLVGTKLAPFVLYAGVFYAVIVGFNYLIQPVARDVGITVAGIGLLYGGFSVLSALSSAASGWLKENVGSAVWFRTVPLALGVVFAAVLPIGLLALPAFFLMRGINEVSRTLEQQYLNDRIRETGRATVLSSVSLVHSVIAIPLQLSVGAATDLLGPETTAGAFGVVLFVAAGTLLFVWNLAGDGVLHEETALVGPPETPTD